MPAESRQLRLRPLAEADLEEIWLYTLKQWSLEQADKYLRDISSTMNGLAAGEKTGRECIARNGYLQYSAGSHIVFYRIVGTTLEVVRVLHQRMDVAQHL
jgi:toxin ParE1/3/4